MFGSPIRFVLDNKEPIAKYFDEMRKQREASSVPRQHGLANPPPKGLAGEETI